MHQLQQMQLQQKQQMQREPSDGSHPRPQSPGSAENAPSPSKRPRLEGPAFNQQGGLAPNGRGQSTGIPGQQVGETGPSNTVQAAHLQLSNGIESNLTTQQFPNFQGQNPMQKNLQSYQNSLSQQQQKQMPNAAVGGPQNQGSPMMTQGADNNAIAAYGYGAGEMGQNGVRGGPGGPPGNGQGNHALQDYQMQLMLLEQQNKKRLMMARQDQDTGGRPDGPGGPPGMGPNGPNFQQGTSPQSGPRSGNSPNPNEQMKRGTPHMNNPGIPSPLPDGQNRGSPSAMNFNIGQGGQMDAGMNQQFYKMDGMNGNMMANGMRPPPSSHPGFNPQAMTQQQQQQMMMARQQQAANWPNGPNGNGSMVTNPTQGPPQAMGTPQQRNMPPPAAPANATNGRTQPSSPQGSTAAPPTPQQANKANPKKKNETKETKTKVNFLAFDAYFCRNVDIDNSGLQRKDPPQTSPLVLHPPPIRPRKPRPLPPQLRLPRYTRSSMVRIQMVLCNLLMVKLWPPPRTLESLRRNLILCHS